MATRPYLEHKVDNRPHKTRCYYDHGHGDRQEGEYADEGQAFLYGDVAILERGYELLTGGLR